MLTDHPVQPPTSMRCCSSIFTFFSAVPKTPTSGTLPAIALAWEETESAFTEVSGIASLPSPLPFQGPAPSRVALFLLPSSTSRGRCHSHGLLLEAHQVHLLPFADVYYGCRPQHPIPRSFHSHLSGFSPSSEALLVNPCNNPQSPDLEGVSTHF